MFHKLKHKIRVFISSKIDNADKVDKTDNVDNADKTAQAYKPYKKYTSIRKHLQYLLLETGLFDEPFVFEEEAGSSIKAKDFYLENLKKSDVVAFLIDNEDGVSEGVQAEYQCAKERDIRKIFVFCDERNKKKTNIQEELERKLEEKYVICHNFYEMAEVAYISLIQDIVTVYTYTGTGTRHGRTGAEWNFEGGFEGGLDCFNGSGGMPNEPNEPNDPNKPNNPITAPTSPITPTIAPTIAPNSINGGNDSNPNINSLNSSEDTNNSTVAAAASETSAVETVSKVSETTCDNSEQDDMSKTSVASNISSVYSIEKIKIPDENVNMLVSYLLSLMGIKDSFSSILTNDEAKIADKKLRGLDSNLPLSLSLSLSFLKTVLYKKTFNKEKFAELKQNILLSFSSSNTDSLSFLSLLNFLSARFDALEAVFEGQIEVAIENARSALNIAITSSFISQWLVLDVAVDIMNLVRIKYQYMEHMEDTEEDEKEDSEECSEEEKKASSTSATSKECETNGANEKEEAESAESAESGDKHGNDDSYGSDKHNDECTTKHRSSTLYYSYSYIDDEDYKSANNLVTQSLVSYPIIDRLQENLYKKIASIYESEQLKSPYRITFGNNDISAVFQYIAKTFIIALMHGSFTHISLIREQIISVLATYINLYSNRAPVVERIRLHFVTGEKKSKLDDIIRTYHADADILTPEEAKDIINSIKRIGIGDRNRIGEKRAGKVGKAGEEAEEAEEAEVAEVAKTVTEAEVALEAAEQAARAVERDKQLFYFCGKFGYYCDDEDFEKLFLDLHNTALTWVRADRSYNLILDYVFSFYEGVLERSFCKKYALDFCLSLMDKLGDKRSLPLLEAISSLLLNIVMLMKSGIDSIDNIDNVDDTDNTDDTDDGINGKMSPKERTGHGDIKNNGNSTNLTPLTPSKIEKIIDFVTYGINDKNIMHVPHLKNLLICLSLWLSETEQSVANYLDCILQSKLPNFYKTEYEFDIALRKATNISDIWDVLAKHIDVYIKGVSKCNALAQEGTYGPNSGYLRALRLIAFNIADNIATTTASNAISKIPKDTKDDADNHHNAGNTDNSVEEANEEMNGADYTEDNRASNNSNNSTDMYTQIKKIADVAIETLSCKTQQIWCKVAACEILMAIRKLMDSQQQLFSQVRTALWNNRFLYSRVENYSSFGSLGFNNDHPIQLEVAYNLLLISYGCEAGYEANLFDLLFSIPNRQKYVVIQSLSYLLSFLRFYDSSCNSRTSRSSRSDRSDNRCSSVISDTSANSGTTIDKHTGDATSTQDSYQNTSNTVIRAICNYVNFCSNNSEERDVKLQAIQLLIELCKYNETRFTALRRLNLFMAEGSAEGATDAKVILMKLMNELENVIMSEPYKRNQYKDNNNNTEEEAEYNEQNAENETDATNYEADYYINSILNQAKICRHYLVRHLAGLIEKKYSEV